jgi:predicted  nucleic acid-binding Zn-ribbon protein
VPTKYPSGLRRAKTALMTEVENLILDHLRHMRGGIDGLREDMREVKTRLGILENQYASMSSRLDRLDARVERIERRLDLADA